MERDSEAGAEIEVVWAEQRFSPVQFHSFGVGPFACTVRVERGETPEEAFDRGVRFLRACARRAYPQARDDFFAAMSDAAGVAKQGRRG